LLVWVAVNADLGTDHIGRSYRFRRGFSVRNYLAPLEVLSLLNLAIQEIERILPRATPEQKLKLHRLLSQKRKLELKARRLLLEQRLDLFIYEAWKFLEPGRKLVWSWHYDLICEYLTLVKQRKLRRLILNVPPRTAKSTIATICFPCWTWLTEPSHAFLCASYSNSLSTDHSVARRNLILSPWYQELWGDRFSLSDDRNLTTQFSNDHMGQMIATSTGSGAEGRGGDTAILDDPMSSQQSLSDVERLAANRWVNNTLKQRLNNPATASIIVIMQRLHELDTTGFVTSEEPGTWKQLTIPLEAEKDEEWVFPISGKTHRRKKGDILQSDRFTPEVVLEKQRNRMVFAGQYQQRPAPLEGNLIKRDEVRYYGGINPLTALKDEALPDRFDRMAISVDCAFKDTETCDYVAIGVIGVKGRRRYLLNVVNEHLDAGATELEIRRQRAAYPQVTAVLVEDKANGPAVVQRLKQNMPGVIEINPQGGKVARMYAAAPEWQAGDWYVARNAAWTEPFINQITQFPTAAHDDMADMMTQAAIWLGGGAKAIYQDAWSEELVYDDDSVPKIKQIRTMGGHVDRFVVVAYGIDQPFVVLDCIDDGTTLWFDREYYWDSRASMQQKTDAQYADELVKFHQVAKEAQVILPPECDTFEAEIQQRGLWYCKVDEDNDNPVQGVRMVASMMAAGKVRIHRRCERTIQEIPTYAYDAKAGERGEEQPAKVGAQCCNALRHVIQQKMQPWRLTKAA
jgi:predicted phage terminase large subunit-like protein